MRLSSKDLSRRTAVKFVVLIGVVSLFADMTYEGARSITGPYLQLLGASATVVGVVTGFGELIGYGFRLVSGYIADRTGRYWAVTIVGYAINMVAVPVLVFADQWPMAAALIMVERLGKAIRTPARDAILSHATTQMGRGWGFGLHEALDQIGAMVGPLLIVAVLHRHGDYQQAFAVLAVPAAITLTMLLAARLLYPKPRDLETTHETLEVSGLAPPFWTYLAAASLVAAGYADFPLIAYHFKHTAVVPEVWIPIFYAMAMGIDALAALFFGHLFDRAGLSILILAALLSACFAPLVFLGGFYAALGGMALWGIGMGAQESIMRAAVAGMASADRRGSAYGLFNTGFGVCWFLGSAAMGWLYDVSVPALIAFSVITQLASVPLLYLTIRSQRLRTHR